MLQGWGLEESQNWRTIWQLPGPVPSLHLPPAPKLTAWERWSDWKVKRLQGKPECRGPKGMTCEGMSLPTSTPGHWNSVTPPLILLPEATDRKPSPRLPDVSKAQSAADWLQGQPGWPGGGHAWHWPIVESPSLIYCASLINLSAKELPSLYQRPQINFISWSGLLIESKLPARTLGFKPL